ncbi:phage tail protein [Brevibacillus laterosporus]|nr:phage tail domain-containing protein [Brevibacillus laterosporus]TPG68894.1 phage tail protein [Brevibacillus laterosporus]
MKEGLDFYYGGIKSTDMGLLNVKVSNGFFEESFVAEKQINEITVRGNDKPYFQSVTRSPLVFSLTFAFEHYYDHEKIRDVARWLDQDYYKPFYTTDNPNRIFFCMLHSDSTLFHNGLKQGYVELEMRCDSPYSYSPQYVTEWNELTGSTTVFTETTQADFQKGKLNNMITLPSGDLQLDSKKPKWKDLLKNKWGDLKNGNEYSSY